MSLQMLSKFRAEKIALSYFLFAMLWILTSDYLLGVMVSDPSLLVSISTYKGLLFVSVTALLLYLVLRVWFFAPEDKVKVTDTKGDKRGLLFVFAALSLVVPLLSTAVIQIAAPQALQSARAQVQLVAESKADSLNQWFMDRRHLVEMIEMDVAVREWLNDWSHSDHNDRGASALTGYINRLHANHYYDGVYLYHLQKEQALASGLIRYNQAELDDLIAQALLIDESYFAGMAATRDHYSLSWVVPLYATDPNNQPLAVLILSLDAQEHLFPSLSLWPGESESGEVFLIQRDSDDQYILLSPLNENSPPVLSRIPYLGEQGEGYTGDKVVAALKPLAEKDWWVAAQVNQQEVLSPVYMMAAWLAVLSMATMISVMFALRLVWVQNRRLVNVAYQMKTAEKDRLLVKFFEMPFVGMAITDPSSGKWLRFNPEMLRLLGYTEAEFKEKTWRDVSHTDDLDIEQQAYQRMIDGEVDSYTIEKQCVRKNGSLFTGLLNVGAVRYPDGTLQYAVSTLQDITDQKRANAELMQQRDLYNTLSETNQTIIRARNQDELFKEVCRIAVVYGQLHYACILRPVGSKMHVVSSFGELPSDLEFFKEDSVIPKDVDPVLDSVIITGVPKVIDHVSDHSSQAYFPVLLDGQLIAVLLYYADDPDFFRKNVISTLQEMSGDIAFAVRFIQQEDALRKAVQVVEASPVVLFRWENQPGWPVSYISSNVSRWGYSTEEFLNGSIAFKDIVHPEDQQWLEEEVALYLSQKRDEYLQEYRILTKDQHVMWVEDITRVSYDPEGKINYIEGVVADVTSRKTVQQRIEFLSRHDSLTSLPNRMTVLTTIDARGNDNTALLMLDLDRFKDVNDSFGHRCGDQLLCSVADLLRKVCPPDALLARFGGDEFGVLLDRSPEDLKEIALTLIDALQTPIRLPNGMEIRIGACVGIANLIEAHQSAEELLRQADAALYKAKEAGREQYCFYTSELTEAALIRLNTEASLREAIVNNELSVYLQPQIDVLTGDVIGAEALLRWHKAAGFISPDEFIPVAEQSGLIHPIGEWVMDQVCCVGQDWMAKGYAPIRLAVNLSSYQLRHGKVIEMIQDKLNHYQYPANLLEVELTESALMRREDEAELILQQLQKMGVSLAIDDFGTGYSSLAYLRNFPLNVLKIDKSFIDELETCTEDREITAAIIAMGHTLGLKILAEGVETQQQLELLRDLGCDFYQGYLTSPAVAVDEFEQRFMKPMASPQGLEPRSGP